MAITVGTLYKRGNVWWWKYLLDGKQVAVSLKTASHAEAKAEQRRRLSEYESAPASFYARSENPTCDDFWKAYERYSADHKSKGTQALEARYWVYLVQALKAKRMGDISAARVEDFKSILKRDGVKGRPLADASINLILRHLKAVWNQGAKLGLVSIRNPFFGVKGFRLPVIRPDYLSTDEIDAVLWAAVTHSKQMYFVCLLGIYAGLRKNELANCRWEWFDFDNRLINVQRGPGFELKDREERVIPMSATLAAALLPFQRPEGYLFHSGRTSERRNRYRFEPKKSLAAVATAAQCPRLTFQLMRHTFGSQHAIAGTSIYKVAKWMGHSSVDVTSKHYAALQAYDEDINRF